MALNRYVISMLLFFTFGAPAIAQDDLDTCLSGDPKDHFVSCLRAAEQGHAGAQLLTGLMYSKGVGVRQNKDKAAAWLNKAIQQYRGFAEQGDTMAQRQLGDLYRRGLGVSQDNKKAAQWYRKAANSRYRLAAERKELEAQYKLGNRYFFVFVFLTGDNADALEALRWLGKAAKQGHAGAQYKLGLMHLEGYGTKTNKAVATEWLTKAAKQGHAQARKVLEKGESFRERYARMQEKLARVSRRWAEKWTHFRSVRDPEAKTRLGKLYLLGQGGEKDVDQAIEWLQEASKEGDPEAQRLLGALYTEGREVRQDHRHAALLFEKAAVQGDSVAQFALGVLYHKGLGIKLDYRKAAEWYEKAANQGDSDAQNNLASLYQSGQGVKQDYRRAAEWYEKAADQGNSSAQHNLGILYETGQGVKQDYRRAAEWYEKAADQGTSTAQVNLAILYKNGRGVPRDYEQAFKLFIQAANQGDVHAQTFLGELYEDGLGVQRSYRHAAYWYKKSARQGDPYAQSALAWLYERGYGVKKHYREAARLYRQAADQGDAFGQERLGRLYYKGLGVPQDLGNAAIWYRRAADQGDPSAQNSLATLYVYGDGVPKNRATAIQWFLKAAIQGHTLATDNVNEFDRREYIKDIDEANDLLSVAKILWHARKQLKREKRHIKFVDRSLEYLRKEQPDIYSAALVSLARTLVHNCADECSSAEASKEVEFLYREAASYGNPIALHWIRKKSVPVGGETVGGTCRPLLVLFGGAWDDEVSITGEGYRKFLPLAVARKGSKIVKVNFRRFLNKVYNDFDITMQYFKSTHSSEDEIIQSKLFIERHLKKYPDSPVALIGHSWGGDVAYSVAQRLSTESERKYSQLLVTLDPVSGDPVKVFQPGFLINLVRWINVHTTGAMIPGSLNNAIARAGNKWGAIGNAENYRFEGDHADLRRMFGIIYGRINEHLTCVKLVRMK